MKALILAAGRGERMRPLTLSLPKPLLEVRGRALIDHHLDKLAAAGIEAVVINTAYLGELIEAHVGPCSAAGLPVSYSREGEPLETAGAIHRAAPLLGAEPFLLVNGDVWSEIDYAEVLGAYTSSPAAPCEGAYLVLVPNPSFKLRGDFCLEGERVAAYEPEVPAYTYAGIAVMSANLVVEYPRCREAFPLKEVFDWAIEEGRLFGAVYQDRWSDVGTVERLQALNNSEGH